MLTEKFFEVLQHEGVVPIVTWGNGEPNITNTWNSYLQIKDENRLLVPAAGFKKAESDISVNNHVKVSLGSREVMGNNNYQGTDFLIEGIGKFLTSGEDFDFMMEKFPFLTRVFEIKVTSSKQLLLKSVNIKNPDGTVSQGIKVYSNHKFYIFFYFYKIQ